MTLFDINTDENLQPEYVKVLDAGVGKGVFAARPYPNKSVIGEITGDLVKDHFQHTNYTFEAIDGYQIEPYEPFRYLNHSCQPNCDFEWLDHPGGNHGEKKAGLYLIAIRDILCEEQFTIDYRWPAAFAIQCQCKEPLCRGWVVDISELDKLPAPA